MNHEHCASCGLDVAAHRVERDGQVFCTWHCSKAAAADGAVAAVSSARARIVEKVRGVRA